MRRDTKFEVTEFENISNLIIGDSVWSEKVRSRKDRSDMLTA